LKGGHLEEHYSLLSRNIYAAETILRFLCEWLTVRSVLDVGCGIGVWMKAISHDAGAAVLGIDIEESAPGGEGLNSELRLLRSILGATSISYYVLRLLSIARRKLGPPWRHHAILCSIAGQN
jgi:SAM-dependent methyltransferase